MAVHCEKFDEERAERVIKISACTETRIKIKFYLRFKDVFSALPTGSGKLFVSLAFLCYLTN